MTKKRASHNWKAVTRQCFVIFTWKNDWNDEFIKKRVHFLTVESDSLLSEKIKLYIKFQQKLKNYNRHEIHCRTVVSIWISFSSVNIINRSLSILSTIKVRITLGHRSHFMETFSSRITNLTFCMLLEMVWHFHMNSKESEKQALRTGWWMHVTFPDTYKRKCFLLKMSAIFP